MEARQLLSTTVYSTAYSPCGKYLAVANNFGFISIFDFEKAINLPSTKWKKSIFTFQAHKGPVHSLITSHNYLLSGGYGPVAAWKWSDILERKPAMSWTLDEPVEASKGSFVSSDVNVLAIDDKKLFCGRDDSLVCVWDLTTRKCEAKLGSHDDYIHDITVMSSSQGLVSASEDGTAKVGDLPLESPSFLLNFSSTQVWDLRTSQVTNTYEPSKHKELSRPEFGKWLSCVTVDENGQWMVCGGGPSLSLWHLRSQCLTAALESPEFIPYTVTFHNDVILAGGNQKNIHHWFTNGEKKAAIPCSIGNIFSLTFQPQDRSSSSPLIAAGTGHKLDVFTNLNYKSHTLLLSS